MISRWGSDCCLDVCLPDDAEPVLIVTADQADADPDRWDPWTDGADSWPVVYWSNGTITGGLDPYYEPGP